MIQFSYPSIIDKKEELKAFFIIFIFHKSVSSKIDIFQKTIIKMVMIEIYDLLLQKSNMIMLTKESNFLIVLQQVKHITATIKYKKENS